MLHGAEKTCKLCFKATNDETISFDIKLTLNRSIYLSVVRKPKCSKLL